MELEERLQKLSKQHSEHRRTFTLSRLAVFLCRGQLGQAGSIPAHGFVSDWYKTQISADLQNKQVDNTSIFSVISVPECG